MDVLLTILLLQIWIGFFSIGLCNGLMSTYSKTFGLTFINDDHYYAILAIFLNIFNGSCRIFWGFSYDRLGFKMCFLVIAAAVTVVTACLPALPQTLSKSQSYKTTSINNNASQSDITRSADLNISSLAFQCAMRAHKPS